MLYFVSPVDALDKKDEPEKGNTDAVIAGAVVGAIAVIGIIFVAYYFWYVWSFMKIINGGPLVQKSRLHFNE